MMMTSDEKSLLPISFGIGVSHGLLSLVFESSPRGCMLAVFFKISSSNCSESLPTFNRNSHWSGYGSKFSSTNTLLPCFLAFPCNGRATKLPSPPSGIVSWLGKKRSYDLKLIFPFLLIASVSMALPSLRALTASTGLSKKIHTWAPLPERERSTEQGMFQLLQTSMNASTSFL